MVEGSLPGHVALIMDGNGRWARSRGLLRFRGHERGAESLRRITRQAARLGIQQITFFALSTENYRRRPKMEVDFLMRLLRDYLVGERPELRENNIRLRAIGRIRELPEDVQAELAETMASSAAHTGMTLRLALNYGARQEILDAVRAAAEASGDGRLDPGSLDEAAFRRFLYDPGMPDPDLIIRTAGEMRLSNFFLWQASYAELWVTEVLWPDFEVSHFDEALRVYAERDRKFGAVKASGPEVGRPVPARAVAIPAPEATD